jgi:hypothetical protein
MISNVSYSFLPGSGPKMVVIVTKHNSGGSAYRFDSAAGDPIEPIPRDKY